MRWLCLGLAGLALLACGRSQRRNVIQNKGSDTLFNVAQAWAEKYKAVNPEVAVAVSGGGSGTGISALINGTVDIANSSREMKPSEVEQARANGVEPKKHVVGKDALAVYVHRDNPIASITIAQLAGIYGEGGTLTQWSQLGVEVPGASGGEIVRFSRQNNSGTYIYFREAVLGRGRDYKLGSRAMHGSKDVVENVGLVPGAIGYSGLAYANETVRLVPVVKEAGGEPVPPTVRTAADESYPIARPLFMYTRGEPEGAVKAYLDWILSEDGQRIIRDRGYAPIRPVSD